MKINFLLSNVTDMDTVTKGISLVAAKLSSIGIPFEGETSIFNGNLTSYPGSYTDTVGQTINYNLVHPSGFPTLPDITCLLYDWTKINPRPTNPANHGKKIQMPMQWYTTFPEVFCQFILHELCHDLRPDLTHNQYQNPAWSQKPPTDYYLHLLKTYYKPSQPIQRPTIKYGSIGPYVVELQKSLKELGYFTGSFLTIFGPKTRSAVMSFQESHSLRPDGIVGQMTWNAIDEAKKKPNDWGLKAKVARLANAFIIACKAQGEDIRITEGYRSFERQNELYAQRPKVTNAKGGESFHNFNVAFDVIFTKTGYKGKWKKVGEIGVGLGLEWGGNFKSIKDNPHFQYLAGYTLKDFQNNKVDWNKFI